MTTNLPISNGTFKKGFLNGHGDRQLTGPPVLLAAVQDGQSLPNDARQRAFANTMNARLWILIVALATPSAAYAQAPCSIAPTSAFRGEHVRLTFNPGTGAKSARVTLRPSMNQPASALPPATPSPSATPIEYGVDSPELIVAGDSTLFAVDTKAPLGRYSVAVTLDGQPGLTCGTLLIALPEKWKLGLAEFAPSGTYDVLEHKVGTSDKFEEVKTISLSLRGNGFLVDVPEDNRVYINGERTPVTWDGCPQQASVDPVAAVVTHGAVINSEQIDLCNVVVPDNHRVVTVEVSQEGVVRSPVRYFRLYWWDRKIVGSVATVVAILLAALVLFLVHRFKDSQSVEQPLGIWQILFLDPETETYSLSKLQFYVWTFAALFAESRMPSANGFPIEADGIYGHFTEALVRQFQSKTQLSVNGVVGPTTRVALGL